MHDDTSIRDAAEAADYVTVIADDGGVVTTFLADRIIGWLDELDRLRSVVADLARTPTPAMPDDDFGAICHMCGCDNLHPDSGTVDVVFPGTAMLAPFKAKHHRQCPWVRAREAFPYADDRTDR